MKKVFFILMAAVFFTSLGSAQEDCEAIEAQSAELGGGEALEQGMKVGPDTTVSTGPSGAAAFACSEGIFSVDAGSQGEVGEIAEREQVDVEAPENTSIEQALKQTDQIEENLDEINDQIQDNIPETLRKLVLGDRVNFKVDNTTIGLKSNSSGITGVEQGGVEDPTLEISMQEDTIRQTLESENSAQAFRQAYESEGVQVEAYSLRNKIIFGAIDLANKAYGFVQNVV